MIGGPDEALVEAEPDPDGDTDPDGEEVGLVVLFLELLQEVTNTAAPATAARRAYFFDVISCSLSGVVEERRCLTCDAVSQRLDPVLVASSPPESESAPLDWGES